MFNLPIKKPKLIIFLILILGVSLIISPLGTIIAQIGFYEDKNEHTEKIISDKPNLSGFNSLSAFIIDDTGAGDYTWVEAALQSWCTGNGTIDNPYIIKSIAVDGLNSSSCIEIKYSSAYFEIKDSLFYNSSDASDEAGIRLFMVQNGRLENNTCINNNGDGINTFNSDFNIIFSNNLSYNQRRGIYLNSNSNNNTIDNNFVTNNQITGIQLQSSSNNEIINNEIDLNNGNGLLLNFADHNEIKWNFLLNNNGNGLQIWQNSHFCKCSDNTISGNLNNGLLIGYNSNVTGTNNVIIDNDYYGVSFNNVKNLTISDSVITDNEFSGIFGTSDSDYCQFIGNNVSNNGHSGFELYDTNHTEFVNNYIFNNGEAAAERGFFLWSCNFGLISGNVILRNYDGGITLSYSSSFKISNNEIKENGGNGVYIYAAPTTGTSLNNQISSNSIEDNANYGIYIRNTVILPSFTNITENTLIQNNQGGIFIESCLNNRIEKNTLMRNNGFGIELESSKNTILQSNIIEDHVTEGIILFNSAKNQLYLNTVRNSTYGIYLNYNCSYNDIYSNRISNNSNGVYLFNDCDNNSIYKNIIEKSSLSAVNIKISPASCDQNIFYENFFLTNAKHVIDLSGTNIWNNTQIGNYWDNYTGSDSNDDGIGDTPYVFSGGIDYLPIWDKSAPVITLNYPANNMRFGHSVPSFNVEITDLYLDKMWYQFIGHTKKFFFLSNGTFDTALWQSEWNSISDGDFISIRFYANDTPGNLASKDLQIIKDGFPIITILEPLDEAKVGRTAPNFVVDVDDYQIDSMWYSIDNGLNNFTFTTNTTIDQTAWQTFWDNLTDNDIITITFYAKDSLGQLSSKSVQVRVSVSTPQSGIPSFDIIIILGTLSIVSLIIIRKKDKY